MCTTALLSQMSSDLSSVNNTNTALTLYQYLYYHTRIVHHSPRPKTPSYRCIVVMALSWLVEALLYCCYYVLLIIIFIMSLHNLPPLNSYTAVNCGPLSPPANGNVQVPSTILGYVSHYHCNQGYVLTTPSTRECLASGRWSGANPVCKRMLSLAFDTITDSVCLAPSPLP